MLKFNIENQTIKRIDNTKVVGNSKNYLKAKFIFSQEWDGKTKTAVFRGATNVFNVLILNNECLVPGEVLSHQSFSLSVFAGDLLTTNVEEIRIIPSGYAIGGVPIDPTPDIYTQLTVELARLTNEINVSKEKINELSTFTSRFKIISDELYFDNKLVQVV